MTLPWNRGGPEDSSDSLLGLLPLVPGSSREDSAAGPERSVPQRVATAEASGGDGRDSPRDRSDGHALGDLASDTSRAPGGESPEPVDTEVVDGEVSVRQ